MVNLLLTSCATHWFDMPKFMEQAKRVLKPLRCLVNIGYFAPKTKFLSKKNEESEDTIAQQAARMLGEAIMAFKKDINKTLTIDKVLAKLLKDTKISSKQFDLRIKNEMKTRI